jgi:hypothetical protein
MNQEGVAILDWTGTEIFETITFLLLQSMAKLPYRELSPKTHVANNAPFIVPFTDCLVFNRSFSVAGPRMWNSLPGALRLTADPNVFKNH